MLKIKNLSVAIGGKQILSDINMNVGRGARHLLVGANGSGKSTLVAAISGSIAENTTGTIAFDGADITNLPTDARARNGIFIGMQNVPEIPGLSITSFLKHSMLARNPDMRAGEFLTILHAAADRADVPESWLARSVNVGFSGGEKKRLMFLHLLLSNPKLAILDEPDSGADADAQKLFMEIIKDLNARGTTFLLISHQQKFTDMFAPSAITTLSHGKIVI